RPPPERIICVTRPDGAGGICQFPDGAKVITGIEKRTVARPFRLRSLLEEALGHHAGWGSFFPDLAAAPDEAALRDIGTVDQPTHGHAPSQTVIGEQGVCVAGSDTCEPLLGIP